MTTEAQRRRQRAAVATNVITIAPDTAAVVEWSDLDAAPAWLGLPSDDLFRLQRQIGALLYASQIQLWIDNARLAAARTAVGEAFLQALLQQRDLDTFARTPLKLAQIDTADQVRAMLQAAGAIVTLATLPAGTLRRALAPKLDPGSTASSLSAELAQSLAARALAIATQASAAQTSAPQTATKGTKARADGGADMPTGTIRRTTIKPRQ